MKHQTDRSHKLARILQQDADEPLESVEERRTNVALDLLKLGVSNAGSIDLMTQYPLEVIERQLEYLRYRKDIKRPEAFIVEAVRKNYSPPKEFYAPSEA